MSCTLYLESQILKLSCIAAGEIQCLFVKASVYYQTVSLQNFHYWPSLFQLHKRTYMGQNTEFLAFSVTEQRDMHIRTQSIKQLLGLTTYCSNLLFDFIPVLKLKSLIHKNWNINLQYNSNGKETTKKYFLKKCKVKTVVAAAYCI